MKVAALQMLYFFGQPLGGAHDGADHPLIPEGFCALSPGGDVRKTFI